jgi:predicted nucleotidyltransferase
MADQQIINKIKDYIHLLNSEGFGICKAFLYGSFATGYNTESSDIDLMLLSKTIKEGDIAKKSRAWVLTRNIDSRIEPYLINFKRFETDDSSPLVEIVKNEGVEVDLGGIYSELSEVR